MRGVMVHRLIRAATRHYPSRRMAGSFNSVLGTLFFDGSTPCWLVSPGSEVGPAMELNVAVRMQRKVYYFSKAWCRWWLSNPLARLMERSLGPGSIFLDIGANIGFFSLHAARLVGPAGQVMAFEPDPDMYESLLRSAKLNGYQNLRCSNTALSNRDGHASFYRAWSGGSNSLVPEIARRRKRYSGAIEVPVRTLDSYWDETGLEASRIRLVKVDVEGEEPRTVAGMLRTLERAGCPPLWVEVRGPQGSTRAPDTFPAVRDSLGRLGYRPYRWTAGKVEPVVEGSVLRCEDILFAGAEHRLA